MGLWTLVSLRRDPWHPWGKVGGPMWTTKPGLFRFLWFTLLSVEICNAKARSPSFRFYEPCP